MSLCADNLFVSVNIQLVFIMSLDQAINQIQEWQEFIVFSKIFVVGDRISVFYAIKKIEFEPMTGINWTQKPSNDNDYSLDEYELIDVAKREF